MLFIKIGKNAFKVPVIAVISVVVFILFITPSCKRGGDKPRYKDPGLPVEERVSDLLSRMTLREKIEQLSGIGFETRENHRLGIPALHMADGPVGVRRGKATAFPAAVGIAAAWNPGLVLKIGAAIAAEARARGLNYVGKREGPGLCKGCGKPGGTANKGIERICQGIFKPRGKEDHIRDPGPACFCLL